MLQTLQLKTGAPYAPAQRREAPKRQVPNGSQRRMVRVDVGRATIGTDDRLRAYDNERPRQEVRLPAFWIDRAPVTNEEYLAFMNDGGYTRRELWSDAGRAWLDESGATSPKYWWFEGGVWLRRSMDHVGVPEPTAPVIHVCYHEADAFARWAGRRLPTETEWEVAASWDPDADTARVHPWGEGDATPADANLDQLLFDVAPVDSYERNVSPLGCYGMQGDVWEWTSTDFSGYSGFAAFPYAEYSEVFFGNEYKVLRGGSWATRPGASRNTFRNWDYPIRRQIFSGFRCARDD
jgi:iron(II)-dependent oxidoreductase